VVVTWRFHLVAVIKSDGKSAATKEAWRKSSPAVTRTKKEKKMAGKLQQPQRTVKYLKKAT